MKKPRFGRPKLEKDQVEQLELPHCQQSPPSARTGEHPGGAQAPMVRSPVPVQKWLEALMKPPGEQPDPENPSSKINVQIVAPDEGEVHFLVVVAAGDDSRLVFAGKQPQTASHQGNFDYGDDLHRYDVMMVPGVILAEAGNRADDFLDRRVWVCVSSIPKDDMLAWGGTLKDGSWIERFPHD